MFKRKEKKNRKEGTIPGWTEPPYNIIALELGTSGLAENWGNGMTAFTPFDVEAILKECPVKKPGDPIALGRRTWILASAYRGTHKDLEEAKIKMSQLNKKIEEDGRDIAKLRIHNKILREQLRVMTKTAEQTTFKIAEVTYARGKGRISKRKIRSLIQEKPPRWNPEGYDPHEVLVSETDTVSDSEPEKGNGDDFDDCPGGPDCPDPDIGVTIMARPFISTKHQVGAAADRVTSTTREYTPAEVDLIITKYAQRNREDPIDWLLRVIYRGGDTCMINANDVPLVRSLMKTSGLKRHQIILDDDNARRGVTLPTAIKRAIRAHYPDMDYTNLNTPWYTISDLKHQVKKEGLVAALRADSEENDAPFNNHMWNRLLRNAPSKYKGLIVSLQATHNVRPGAEILDRIQDMNEGDEEELESKRPPPPYVPRQSDHRYSDPRPFPSGKGKIKIKQEPEDVPDRNFLFKELRKAGTDLHLIDGAATRVLWNLYKQKVLRKKQVQSVQRRDTERSYYDSKHDATSPRSLYPTGELAKLMKDAGLGPHPTAPYVDPKLKDE